MNTTPRITLGILAAAAIFGGGVMAFRRPAHDTFETPARPYRHHPGTVAGTRHGPPETPRQPGYRATTLFQIHQSSAPDVFGFASSASGQTSDELNAKWLEAQG